jgi:hypothetical protein
VDSNAAPAPRDRCVQARKTYRANRPLDLLRMIAARPSHGERHRDAQSHEGEALLGATAHPDAPTVLLACEAVPGLINPGHT